jgi:hypothetical protein
MVQSILSLQRRSWWCQKAGLSWSSVSTAANSVPHACHSEVGTNVKQSDSQTADTITEQGFRLERTTGIEPASSAWKLRRADFVSGVMTCEDVL